MRRLLCAAAMASAMSATAAWADGNPAPAATGAAATAAFDALAVPLTPPLDRVDLVMQKPAGDDPFNRLKGALRHRFGSAMMDLYPADTSGFHLSFGTRFFKKQYIQRDQQEATHGLLYVPRLPRGANGGIRGFRRATPAATFGYTDMVRPNVMIGLEAGTLLGRVVQPLPSGRRLSGLPGGVHGDRSMRMNPVLNATLAYAF